MSVEAWILTGMFAVGIFYILIGTFTPYTPDSELGEQTYPDEETSLE